LPVPPPLDAVPLDAEAALLMLRSYDESLWHRLVFVHDLDRAAVIARAVHERRWPNGEPAPQAARAESPQGYTHSSKKEEEPPGTSVKHRSSQEEPPAPPRSTSARKRK
jgi:hypothetical protein